MNTLTLEQKEVFDSVIAGENVFCSGIAGCGKSYLIQVIYDEIPKRKRGGSGLPYRIQKTALTGCAAILLGQGSKTIHSWSGVGIARDSVEELAQRIKKNTKAKKNWLCTDLLIVDEISMMTCELLEKLDRVGQIIRNCRKPFGGIQLLLVGDFCQLPPIVREYSSDKPVFAFESPQWSTIVNRVYHLQSIQRQQDEDFQRVLVEARNGTLSAESIAILKGRQGLSWRKMKIKPTLLFPKKTDVEYVNETNLGVLKDDKRKFIAITDTPPGFNAKDPWFIKAIETMDTEANYSTELILCLKAQVMLIHNLNTEIGLVNGSRGVIVGFEQANGNPIVEFMNGCKMPISQHQWEVEGYKDVYRKQIPLRLAWAITIHKAQGATLDCALIDIGTNTFEFGQAYVALSRVRSLDSLYIHDFADDSIRCHPKVKKFYAKFQPSLYNIMSQKVNKVVEEVIEEDNRSDTDEEKENSKNWLYADLPDNWKSVLTEKEKELGVLSDMLNGKEYLPHREDIWNALNLTQLKDVRVVILGQDPYPTAGNAHGLAFSIRPEVKVLPGSLRNIYKELDADLGVCEHVNGSLIHWAKQGVLLLNTVLTVESGKPQSHAGQGWEEITDAIIQAVYKKNPNVIFVFWGKSAQVKKKLIGGCKHIIEAPHPSPLSARTGFFGSKPFSKINGILEELGQPQIKWS